MKSASKKVTKKTVHSADYKAGFATGKTAGFATGKTAGFATGKTAGFATGKTAGFATGKTAGFAILSTTARKMLPHIASAKQLAKGINSGNHHTQLALGIKTHLQKIDHLRSKL